MSPRSLPGVGVAACCAAAEERRGDLRSYALVTGAYWADTITDGAIRTLILFYFFKRGYSPFEVASLGAAAAKRSATLAQARPRRFVNTISVVRDARGRVARRSFGGRVGSGRRAPRYPLPVVVGAR